VKPSQSAAALAALGHRGRRLGAGAALSQPPGAPGGRRRDRWPDIVARVVAAKLQEQTGQPFVVENQRARTASSARPPWRKRRPMAIRCSCIRTVRHQPVRAQEGCLTTRRRISLRSPTSSERRLSFAVANSVPVRRCRNFWRMPKQPGVQLRYSHAGVGNTSAPRHRSVRTTSSHQR